MVVAIYYIWTMQCNPLCIFENVSNTSKILSQQSNITIDGKLIEWHSVQTSGNEIDAISETCKVLCVSNIVGIVGPGLSREAHIIATFAKTIGIPVISYSATDPDLSDRNVYSNFYRTAPSDKTTATAIIKLFKRFNWTSSILIYQNDTFGIRGAKVITEEFIKNNLTIQESIIFYISTLSIHDNLKTKLINSESRIVILWVQSTYIPLILQDALKFNLVGPEFIWILSSTISLDSFNTTYNEKLIGLLTIEPVAGTFVNASINTTLLNATYNIWQKYELESFPGSSKVNSFALFAFDATWPLIKSLEKLCSTIKNNSSSSCLSFIESSFCFDRRFIQSNLLLNSINQIEFLGVSGPIKFNLNNNLTDRINGSYYYVQNLQSFSNGLNFVPVLEYTDSDDWNFYKQRTNIVWPGNSLIISTDRAILKGKRLRIGIIESIPFTIIINYIDNLGQNKTKYTGYICDLIELLKNKIGFVSDIQLVQSNQPYSESVEAVAKGDYDIIIGDVTITAARIELVDFSNVIFDTSVGIIARRIPDVNIDPLSFLKPFSSQLWLLVFGICIYAAFLLCLIERQDNERLQNRSILFQFLMSVWYSFGNIVGYGVDFNVNTAAGRLLTAGLYMLSLILLATYTANLTSDLTISKSKDIISGIDDIKDGKIPSDLIGVLVDTAIEEYYLREISFGRRDYYPLKSRKELYDSLLEGIIDVAFLDSAIAEYFTDNIYCNLTLIGEDFRKGGYGIIIPKKWVYANDLDVQILSLRESGQLEQLRRKWFQKKICPISYEISTAIQIKSMSGLFLIFGLITILSFLLFLWSKRSTFKKHFFNLLS
ncbi:unnamed protein product [Rotaria sordida]|uniref:Ionotropic glutamate receptor C-terminal domain-containing protein n=2 Tax=Rotaria sordida TaxID=392033 RepID=A0A815Q2X3_9BILA|nr:unnamed protein product [Rotaria sordida]